MKNIGIRVTTNKKEILSIVLSMDEGFLNKLNWKILFLEGTYNDKEMLSLEELVNSSEYGVVMSYQEVKALSNRVYDLWNILFLGQLEKNNQIKKSDEDAVIFDSSDVVVEYFDSNYWTITSSNSSFIESIKRAVGQVFEAYSP